jgi:K+-sensing histidine kinase KdpD
LYEVLCLILIVFDAFFLFLTAAVAMASTTEIVYLIVATVTAVVIGSVFETQVKQRAMKKAERAKRTDA